MRRVVVLEQGSDEQEQYIPYARDAYESALWQMITGQPMSSPPTRDELLQFAMQSGVKQQRLYAARAPAIEAPPRPHDMLSRILRGIR